MDNRAMEGWKNENLINANGLLKVSMIHKIKHTSVLVSQVDPPNHVLDLKSDGMYQVYK